MIRALLLDLDDTLLINDWQTFYRPYLALLLSKVSYLVPRQRFLQAFNAGTMAMMRNDGSNGSNRDAFFEVFFSLIDTSPQELLPLLEHFYQQDFDTLRCHTSPDSKAPQLVRTALESGLKVAIATQPVFPREAILARLRWAGVGPDLFDYDYVADYELQGACKPHPSYFQRITTELDLEPQECMMVGDSIESDMPASALGFKTFFVERRQAAPDGLECSASGNLADLTELIRTGAIHHV